jgi:Mn2+/Fe2+ NRAMP family transporter
VGHVLLEVGIVIVIVYAAVPLFNPEIRGLGESVAEYLPPIAGQLGNAIFGMVFALAFAWIGVSICMARAIQQRDLLNSAKRRKEIVG